MNRQILQQVYEEVFDPVHGEISQIRIYEPIDCI